MKAHTSCVRSSLVMALGLALLVAATVECRTEPKKEGGKALPAKENGAKAEEGSKGGDCINLVELGKEKAEELGADLTTIEALLEEVIGEDDLTIVKEALSSAKPDEKVATIFAPSNKALETALTDLGITKEDLMANKPLIGKILKFHIVPGEALMAADLAKMDGEMLSTALDGEELEVSVEDKNVQLMPADGDEASVVTVEKPDIETCHAVVHVIDGVLLPPDFDMDAMMTEDTEDGDEGAAAEGDTEEPADDAAEGGAEEPADDAAEGGAEEPAGN